jgi:hypothetical protein
VNKLDNYLNDYLTPDAIKAKLNGALDQANGAVSAAKGIVDNAEAVVAKAAQDAYNAAQSAWNSFKSWFRRGLAADSPSHNSTLALTPSNADGSPILPASKKRRLDDAVAEAQKLLDDANAQVTRVTNMLDSFNNGDIPRKMNSAASTVQNTIDNFKVTSFYLGMQPLRYSLCMQLSSSTDTPRCYYDQSLSGTTSLTLLGSEVYNKVMTALLDATGVSLGAKKKAFPLIFPPLKDFSLLCSFSHPPFNTLCRFLI